MVWTDFVRDLQLSRSRAEILASRVQTWNLFTPNTKVTYYRKMSQTFSDFFKRIDVFCLSNDIPGPFNEIYQNYDPNEWYLFIDLSKYSLEVVLYHKGNVKPCMPIDHSVNSKRT